MDRSSDSSPADGRAVQPQDVLGELERLRDRLREAVDAPGDLDPVLSSLSAALDQVLAEHRGMADELISTYEQLGIVFEVTRQLPSIHSESEIVHLFRDNLRCSFAGRQVHAARPGPDGNWSFDGRSIRGDAWLGRFVRRSIERRSVIVEAPSDACIGLDGVRAAEVMAGPVSSGDDLVCVIVLIRSPDAPEFRSVDMLLIDSLTTFCGDLIRNLRLVGELRSLSISMVRSLVGAVDQKDEYTCGHSLRVAYFATELGRRLRLDEEQLRMLQWAALLHDVGKIGIRDDVLKKPGRLNDEEFEHIKEHPIRSHKVVRGVPQLANALDGILYHHERYDGRGYPTGLSGERIPLQARIVHIADVFDALTSNRAYRKAFSWERALAILEEEAGKTVDPQLQKEFDAMIRRELDKGPGAWQRMVDRANRFTQVKVGAAPFSEGL